MNGYWLDLWDNLLDRIGYLFMEKRAMSRRGKRLLKAHPEVGKKIVDAFIRRDKTVKIEVDGRTLVFKIH